MSADAHGAEKKDEHAGEEKPKKSKKKLIIIALGAISLIGGAGVPMLLMGGAEKPTEEAVVEEEHKEEPAHIETADLGQFVVNLSESNSFLKVHIMMEYDAAIIDKQTAAKEGGEEGGKAHGGGASGGEKAEGAGGVHPHLAKKENQLRDVVIQILSSKQSSELLTSDGKNRVKQELVEGLNEAIGLEEPPVVGILFTEFIIQ